MMGWSAKDLELLGPEARLQALQRLGQQQQKKDRKYHNNPTSRMMPDRSLHIFDSKKEARRYDELMLMLKAGQIRNLKLQAQFTLQESYITHDGERIRAIRYIADFVYEKKKTICAKTEDGEESWSWDTVVEDVKSSATKTEKYKIKAKLLKERFGLTISEV